MKFYRLEPEVAGGIGPGTVMDRSVSPPRIELLHYVFDGWLGDELLTSFLCFIVTEQLANELQRLNASGARFADVKITQSLLFEDLHPNKALPKFRWMQVFGTPGEDDFGISSDRRLVVSGTILNTLKLYGLTHCDITAWAKD